ncbi:oligosaccharide translocase [Saccharobesus litoralis]|uniref:Oligosaccharide translocase n=1 Tax=Saccharobesus litoralis TaxID=2172099 RepID=A0A2S0VM34_9ALTE|nr:oligosaccharide translocase [Saccharobesus litoralis]AWB65268.1 oligosaccharide translocase [Saccharobesus litoralis]
MQLLNPKNETQTWLASRLVQIKLPKALIHTLMYGVSIVFMKGLSLILLPFLTHALSQQEYGQLEVLSSIAILGSVLAGLGLAEALFRFYGLSKTTDEAQSHAAHLLLLAILVAAAMASLAWVCYPQVQSILPGYLPANTVLIVLLTISLEAIIAVALGWLRLQDKVGLFCTLTCGRALLQLLLTFYWVELGQGVNGIVLAGFIAATIQAFLLLMHFANDLNRHLVKRSILNFSLLKSYLQYCTPIMLSGLIAFGLMGVDKWFLAKYADLNQVAILGVASKFALATVILLQPYTMWWSPKRFQVLQQQGQQLTSQYIVIGLALLLFICVVMAGASPLLVHFLVPVSYQNVVAIITPMILAMACKEAAELVNIGCFVGKTSHSQMAINAFSAGLFVLLLWWLTPSFGMFAVAWGLLAVQCTRLTLFYLVSQTFLKLNYPLGKLLLIGTISTTLVVLLPYLMTLGYSVTMMSLCLLSTSTLIAWLCAKVLCNRNDLTTAG